MKSMRIMLGVVGVTALLVVALAAGCGKKVQEAVEVARVAKDAQDGKFTMKGEKGETVTVDAQKARDDAGKVTITDDKGQTHTSEYGKNTVKQEDVGIDFYPGAEVETGARADTSGESGAKVSMVSLLTDDPQEKVAAFYKEKYAQGNTVVEQGENLMITINAGENAGKMIMVTKHSETGKTQVVIHAMAGNKP